MASDLFLKWWGFDDVDRVDLQRVVEALRVHRAYIGYCY